MASEDLSNEIIVVVNDGAGAYDPTDPVERLLFNVLGMVAEFAIPFT